MLTHGYAVTTEASQGATCDTAIFAASAADDVRRYVGLTRGRHAVALHGGGVCAGAPVFRSSMIASAKSRLGQAIAQSVSIDGRTVDRRRLAEVIGVAGPDDPLVLMLEAVCLAVEARACMSDVIAERAMRLEQRLESHAVALDGALGRHLQAIGTAGTEIDARLRAAERDHDRLTLAIDGRVASIAAKQAEVQRSGVELTETAGVLMERVESFSVHLVLVVFTSGIVLGVGVCLIAMRHFGH